MLVKLKATQHTCLFISNIRVLSESTSNSLGSQSFQRKIFIEIYNGVVSGDSWLLFHALPVFFIRYYRKLCIQRQMVVTHIFYFVLCQSSLLSTVIIFAYKNEWWFEESMAVTFFIENTFKKIILSPLHTNSSFN